MEGVSVLPAQAQGAPAAFAATDLAACPVAGGVLCEPETPALAGEALATTLRVC